MEDDQINQNLIKYQKPYILFIGREKVGKIQKNKV